ncbi:MAG: ABC transporter permease [Candidatus Eisenbacteria bacterium]|nr:ABC transporter permease [Candidatus Eisenbacteria bacterium]
MKLSWARALTVARREFRVTVSRKSFILSIVGVPLYFAFVFWASAMAPLGARGRAAENFRSLGVVDSSGQFPGASREIRMSVAANPFAGDRARRAHRAEVRFYPDLTAAQSALRENEVSEVLVVPADYLERGRVRLYGHSDGFGASASERAVRAWLARGLLEGRVDSLRAERALKPAAEIASYARNRQGRFELRDDRRRIADLVIPIGLGMLLAICIMSGGQYLLQGLAEEKESRILESMLCSVSPEELLAGKLIGLGGAGLTLVAAWMGMAGVGAGAAAAVLPLHFSAGMLLAAVAYFVLGYLMFASMMAGVGAVAGSAREAQQISVMFVVSMMFPFFVLTTLLESPDSALAVGLSLFPTSAPLAMMLRMASPVSSVPAWQVGLSLALLALGAWLALRVSARIFRIGMLAYGKTPNLAEVIRWARTR